MKELIETSITVVTIGLQVIVVLNALVKIFKSETVKSDSFSKITSSNLRDILLVTSPFAYCFLIISIQYGLLYLFPNELSYYVDTLGASQSACMMIVFITSLLTGIVILIKGFMSRSAFYILSAIAIIIAPIWILALLFAVVLLAKLITNRRRPKLS